MSSSEGVPNFQGQAVGKTKYPFRYKKILANSFSEDFGLIDSTCQSTPGRNEPYSQFWWHRASVMSARISRLKSEFIRLVVLVHRRLLVELELALRQLVLLRLERRMGLHMDQLHMDQLRKVSRNNSCGLAQLCSVELCNVGCGRGSEVHGCDRSLVRIHHNQRRKYRLQR